MVWKELIVPRKVQFLSERSPAFLRQLELHAFFTKGKPLKPPNKQKSLSIFFTQCDYIIGTAAGISSLTLLINSRICVANSVLLTNVLFSKGRPVSGELTRC